MTIVNHLSFDPNQLRAYLTTRSTLIDGSGPAAKYHNAITGESVGFSTESACLADILTTLQSIAGAQYGDSLVKLQNLYASL